MMTYEASEQLVMSKITEGSVWEFYMGDGNGAFYWIVSEPSRRTVDMWRVGPRGGTQIVLSATEGELRCMLRVLLKQQGKLVERPYTPEEHAARADAEIKAIKEGMGG